MQNSNNQIIGDYQIKKIIGQGTFGKVKLAKHIPTGELVAVKILEKSKIVDPDDMARVNREIQMIQNFNHRNIVLVTEIFESQDHYFIAMEYCERGELFNYIVKNRRLTDEEAAFFYYQIIEGLEYIHKQHIVHRDLKPENLLLTSNYILKIIDFGLSNYFKDNNNLLSTPCGSPCYASPEMVSGEKYNGFKIDIWSTGIILYAMLCGYLPFEDKNNEILFKKIIECKLELPTVLSKDSKDLMRKILVTDPKKRISIEDIKKHPFYLKGKALFNEEFGLIDELAVEEDKGTDGEENDANNNNNNNNNNINNNNRSVHLEDLTLSGKNKDKNNNGNKIKNLKNLKNLSSKDFAINNCISDEDEDNDLFIYKPSNTDHNNYCNYNGNDKKINNISIMDKDDLFKIDDNDNNNNNDKGEVIKNKKENKDKNEKNKKHQNDENNNKSNKNNINEFDVVYVSDIESDNNDDNNNNIKCNNHDNIIAKLENNNNNDDIKIINMSSVDSIYNNDDEDNNAKEIKSLNDNKKIIKTCINNNNIDKNKNKKINNKKDRKSKNIQHEDNADKENNSKLSNLNEDYINNNNNNNNNMLKYKENEKNILEVDKKDDDIKNLLAYKLKNKDMSLGIDNKEISADLIKKMNLPCGKKTKKININPLSNHKNLKNNNNKGNSNSKNKKINNYINNNINRKESHSKTKIVKSIEKDIRTNNNGNLINSTTNAQNNTNNNNDNLLNKYPKFNTERNVKIKNNLQFGIIKKKNSLREKVSNYTLNNNNNIPKKINNASISNTNNNKCMIDNINIKDILQTEPSFKKMVTSKKELEKMLKDKCNRNFSSGVKKCNKKKINNYNEVAKNIKENNLKEIKINIKNKKILSNSINKNNFTSYSNNVINLANNSKSMRINSKEKTNSKNKIFKNSHNINLMQNVKNLENVDYKYFKTENSLNAQNNRNNNFGCCNNVNNITINNNNTYTINTCNNYLLSDYYNNTKNFLNFKKSCTYNDHQSNNNNNINSNNINNNVNNNMNSYNANSNFISSNNNNNNNNMYNYKQTIPKLNNSRLIKKLHNNLNSNNTEDQKLNPSICITNYNNSKIPPMVKLNCFGLSVKTNSISNNINNYSNNTNDLKSFNYSSYGNNKVKKALNKNEFSNTKNANSNINNTNNDKNAEGSISFNLNKSNIKHKKINPFISNRKLAAAPNVKNAVINLSFLNQKLINSIKEKTLSKNGKKFSVNYPMNKTTRRGTNTERNKLGELKFMDMSSHYSNKNNESEVKDRNSKKELNRTATNDKENYSNTNNNVNSNINSNNKDNNNLNINTETNVTARKMDINCFKLTARQRKNNNKFLFSNNFFTEHSVKKSIDKKKRHFKIISMKLSDLNLNITDKNATKYSKKKGVKNTSNSNHNEKLDYLKMKNCNNIFISHKKLHNANQIIVISEDKNKNENSCCKNNNYNNTGSNTTSKTSVKINSSNFKKSNSPKGTNLINMNLKDLIKTRK